MKPQEKERTKLKIKRSVFIQKVKTREEANKVLKSITKFFYIIGFLVLIFGIAGISVVPQESGIHSQFSGVLIIVIIGLMFLIPSFWLRKKKSKAAGIILFILCCYGIVKIIGNFMRGDSGGGAVANILLLLLLLIGLLSSIEAIRIVKSYNKLKSEEIAEPLSD